MRGSSIQAFYFFGQRVKFRNAKMFYAEERETRTRSNIRYAGAKSRNAGTRDMKAFQERTAISAVSHIGYPVCIPVFR